MGVMTTSLLDLLERCRDACCRGMGYGAIDVQVLQGPAAEARCALSQLRLGFPLRRPHGGRPTAARISRGNRSHGGRLFNGTRHCSLRIPRFTVASTPVRAPIHTLERSALEDAPDRPSV